jgi:signal transduction histidine kinase
MFDVLANGISGSGGKIPGKGDVRKGLESPDKVLANCPDLLAGLSRELRSQMNSIVSFAFLLESGKSAGNEREEYNNLIYEACQAIITMFDNFLDSSVIDLGNSESEQVTITFETAFSGLYSEFREALKKRNSRELILVTEHYQPDPNQYRADINRLGRIIRNLFMNALGNTKAGYIKLGYFISGNKLTFYILDSGDGYDRNLEYIQTSDPGKSLKRFNDPFTAINLLFTRKLIKLLEGSVWVERNGLTGSGIYFSVPAEPIARTDFKANRLTDTKIIL